MLVNVCPTATTSAPIETLWQILVTTERYADWTDAEVVSVEPAGLASPGQRITLAPRAFGRRWRATIDVGRMDAGHRWIDLVARLPFGVVNREHVVLSEVDRGRTRVRLS